ncbi:MAG: chemotaxis protein CheW [Nitrococcus mobilis]|nr:chemotaxis protein CheW [Nitrococcus mobilis]
MAHFQAESIRCLLIPVVEYNLILPAGVVAEVVGYQEPDPLPDCLVDQEWLLGFAGWRDQKVPVISMEAVMTGAPAAPSIRARIVILKGLGQRSQLPYFGMLARELPRLTTLSEPTVERLDEFAPLPGIYCQVLAGGEPALLPDLEEIESQMHAVLFD